MFLFVEVIGTDRFGRLFKIGVARVTTVQLPNLKGGAGSFSSSASLSKNLGRIKRGEAKYLSIGKEGWSGASLHPPIVSQYLLLLLLIVLKVPLQWEYLVLDIRLV